MSGMNEQAIMEILEKIRYRFYGKYRGSVTEVDGCIKPNESKTLRSCVCGRATSK